MRFEATYILVFLPQLCTCDMIGNNTAELITIRISVLSEILPIGDVKIAQSDALYCLCCSVNTIAKYNIIKDILGLKFKSVN